MAPSFAQNAYDLILKRGRGKKRRFNNKRARVLRRAGKRTRGGGWVTVQVLPGNEQVKWRNKAWENVDEGDSGLLLEDLKDDVLMHVFSLLGAGGSSVLTSQEELSADYSDEYLERDLSPEFVDIQFSLADAVNLHKTIALLSKRFNRLCNTENLPVILGYLDADLIVNTWWQFVPWLTKYSLRLKSLAFKSHLLRDSCILLYIMSKCNVQRLTTLVAIFTSTEQSYYQQMRTLAELAWFQKSSISRERPVDVDAPTTPTSLEQACRDLGLPSNLYYDFQVERRRDLHDTIADNCPNLESLKITHDFGENVDPEIKNGKLFRKESIRRLNLVLVDVAPVLFTLSWSENDVGSSSLSTIVNTLPNLKILKMTRGQSSRGYEAQAYQFSSTSLQCINVVDAGKSGWVTRCVCPNLRRFLCSAHRFGNGVRPRNDDGDLELESSQRGQYFAGSTRFDGRLIQMPFRDPIDFDGLDVPDSCLVLLV